MLGPLNEVIDKYVDKYLREKELGYFSIKEKIFLYRELAYLIEGWVAIADSVLTIKYSTDKGSVKKICDDMYASLNEWETLSHSMSGLPRYFNEGDVNIIKSGEESWEMTRVLKYLAEEYEFLAHIKSKYIGAMIYPSMLFAVAIGAVFLLFTQILPNIFELVTAFPDIKLPATTLFIRNMTNFMVENTVAIIVTVIIVWFAGWVFMSTIEWKRFLDQHIFNLPLIGKVTKYYDMVKFMRYMKLLMSAWMSFLQVFTFLKDIMGNLSYKQMLDDIISGINKGETIGSVLEKYDDIINKDVIALLKVGEETASFEGALTNAIAMYTEEFNKILDGLSKAIEPILIVFMGGIVAMVALSVFGMIGSLLDGVQSGLLFFASLGVL